MKIELEYGTYTKEYNNKIKTRTGKHIGTLNEDATIKWVRSGYKSEMQDIVQFLNYKPSSSNLVKKEKDNQGRYLQDGYWGTSREHGRGYDGIESEF